jgi:CheY-like chemotaxis protein
LSERFGTCQRCGGAGRLFFVLDRHANRYDWLCRGCELASSRSWLAAKVVEVDRKQKEIFSAELPAMRERTSAAPASPASSLVLVVEDDDDIADAVCEILRDAAFLTARARDGIEGLQHLGSLSSRLSLVLLDLMMPRMNGWEFYERMLREPGFRKIPVVLMTAVGETRSGSLPMLRKPLSVDQLLETVMATIANAARVEAQ